MSCVSIELGHADTHNYHAAQLLSGQVEASVTYEPLYPILGAGLIYMLMIAVLVKAQSLAERQARRLAV